MAGIKNDNLFFPHYSIAAINCNSLNISTISSCHFKLKLYGIVKLRTDFILLSDTRLNCEIRSQDVRTVNKTFLVNPYKSYNFFHNSLSNSRGVGILIKKSLNVSVSEVGHDEEGNILALKISTEGKSDLLLISVYGPNKNDPSFFETLSNILQKYAHLPVILGGDWNCTFSDKPVLSNPDIFKMSSVPNLKHSVLLKEMCNKFNLCDPFRCFYPHKLDFSYVPRDPCKKNRSRLDFFLVDKATFQNVHLCEISPHMQNFLFDHKAIILDFRIVKTKKNTISISNSILDYPLVGYTVSMSVAECYAHHLDPWPWSEPTKDTFLARLGTIRKVLRELCLEDDLLETIRNEQDRLQREASLANIKLLLEEVDWPVMQYAKLNIEDDLFLEFLVNCVRSDVVSLQAVIAKATSAKIIALQKDLQMLKANFESNFKDIQNKEKLLNDLQDTLMKKEIEKHSLFDNLNFEKITPFFVKMAKCAKPEADLADILKSDGTPFEDDKKRNDYITSFYANLYKNTSTKKDFKGCIEKFLGPDICEHKIVKESKLSNSERDSLEKPLDISELDKAVKEANRKSAPGVDGLSMAFISKFWNLLRTPLFRYAICCFKKGVLTNTFRTACVRLIPKKGDVTNIKNWRPISLLSNLYKIISRAINNRLNTVMSRITSRAQKGFTNTRYLQEVLINTIENIGHCNSSKTSGVIFAIDMAKAFDTLNHSFLSECYNFFNLGPIFTNMMETVGSSRTASIILEDGCLSESFPLETGRPQGEILSPNQYNIGNQILLFKLELDPGILSIYPHLLGPSIPFPIKHFFDPANARFINESARETDKAEGFADDTSVFTLRSSECVKNVKNILISFAEISGLKTNFEKSSIIPIGNLDNNPISDPVIKVDTHFTLLGMVIDNKAENLLANFDSTISKMNRVVQFWDRFSLTLPGRISIAKTFLFSLINHLGCFLQPSEEQVAKMQNIIDGFCTGKLRTAADRIHLDPADGGLGIFSVKNFLVAQQVCWFKRAAQSSRDNWRVDLLLAGYGNIFTINPKEMDRSRHPILMGLAESFSTFIKCFTERNDNFYSAFILNNPAFLYENNTRLNLEFFGRSSNIFKIAQLTFNDFFSGGTFLSFVTLNEKFGININLATYFRLRGTLLHFLGEKKKKSSNNNDNSVTGINRFFLSFKKGSKTCRKILDKVPPADSVTKLQTVITFFGLLEIPVPDANTIRLTLAAWNIYALANNFKEFIFKFHNNKLGLNSRTFHFGGDNPGCTFCSLRKANPLPRESFCHLFFDCPPVQEAHATIDEIIFGCQNSDTDAAKKLRWSGFDMGSQKNIFKILAYLNIQYQIWVCKLKKKVPVADNLVGEMVYELDPVCRLNSSIHNARSLFNCPISRHWDRFRRPRW